MNRALLADTDLDAFLFQLELRKLVLAHQFEQQLDGLDVNVHHPRPGSPSTRHNSRHSRDTSVSSVHPSGVTSTSSSIRTPPSPVT